MAKKIMGRELKTKPTNTSNRRVTISSLMSINLSSKTFSEGLCVPLKEIWVKLNSVYLFDF